MCFSYQEILVAIKEANLKKIEWQCHPSALSRLCVDVNQQALPVVHKQNVYIHITEVCNFTKISR